VEHSDYIAWLALTDFGRDLLSSDSWRSRRNFVFVSTTLPISRRPDFTKFEHNTLIGVTMNPFGFWNKILKIFP